MSLVAILTCPHPGNISYSKSDVSKKAVSELFPALSALGVSHYNVQIGEPTVLINNAGVFQGKLFLDLSPAGKYHTILSIHLELCGSRTCGVNVISQFSQNFLLSSFFALHIKAEAVHIVSASKRLPCSAMGVVGVAQMA